MIENEGNKIFVIAYSSASFFHLLVLKILENSANAVRCGIPSETNFSTNGPLLVRYSPPYSSTKAFLSSDLDLQK